MVQLHDVFYENGVFDTVGKLFLRSIHHYYSGLTGKYTARMLKGPIDYNIGCFNRKS